LQTDRDRQALPTEHHNPGAASSKMKRLMATCTLLLGAPYDGIRQSFGVSKEHLYKKYGTPARGAIIA